MVVPTYDKVHENFIVQIQKFDKELLNKIFIFKNDDNLLNLVEIISKTECLINPSTGTIHIASNLKIPTIGLYTKKDSILWYTYDKNYVFIDNLNEKNFNEIINQTVIKIEQYIKN
ncbi:glycosyltransferase family 9 protein [Campylobacter sp. CNRCH_2013_0898h]|uniref:glycosyltransferase family 9 protein n=1 Tax=Campylobacter sp. CNRCH_2013_0898h TaxID=2911601 RepID=UPI0039958B21